MVGAGYTGTEVVAQIQLLTHDVLSRHLRLAGVRPQWLLLDTADHVLPGMDERLSATAERVLSDRGVEVNMGTSVIEATATGSSSPTTVSSRRTHSSGASAYVPTRWRRAPACP